MNLPAASYLNDIYFDWGGVTQTASLLPRYGIQNPLVVTDRHLKALGIVDRTGLSDYAVFDDVETNPSESSAREALERYRTSGCDGLIAIGGGSPIDLAKIVGLMVEHTDLLASYAIVERGPAAITGDVPPLVAVPTTAGSGSEVGRAALITVRDGRKLGFLSPKLLPVAAVCDPELTVSCPDSLTAATGMDAISHCVEAILSPRANPVADVLARDGLTRGVRAIRQVRENPQSRRDREDMVWCSVLGGLAFQKGLGVVHALSHPLGRFEGLRLHHGTLNGLFLPEVLRFNANAKIEMKTVSNAVGGVDPASFFEDLLVALNLPSRLSDLGVTESHIQSSATLAATDHCVATNPRPFSEVDALNLYRRCL